MKEASEIDFIIYTCDRPQNFLKTTVSALMDQNIKPFISYGSYYTYPGAGSIYEIPAHLRSLLVIKPLEEASLREAEFERESLVYKSSKNLSAALLIGDMKYDALIMEDDVIPCKNLKHQLAAIYSMLKNVPDTEKYIIALYSNYDWGVGPQALVDYPHEQFYGLQACIYSANIREAASKYYGIGEKPTDTMTAKIAANEGARLMAVRFSLFQHIGIVSSGLGKFHQTLNFLDGTNLYPYGS